MNEKREIDLSTNKKTAAQQQNTVENKKPSSCQNKQAALWDPTSQNFASASSFQQTPDPDSSHSLLSHKRKYTNAETNQRKEIPKELIAVNPIEEEYITVRNNSLNKSDQVTQNNANVLNANIAAEIHNSNNNTITQQKNTLTSPPPPHPPQRIQQEQTSCNQQFEYNYEQQPKIQHFQNNNNNGAEQQLSTSNPSNLQHQQQQSSQRQEKAEQQQQKHMDRVIRNNNGGQVESLKAKRNRKYYTKAFKKRLLEEYQVAMVKERLNLWQLLERASQREQDSSQAISVILNHKQNFEDIQKLNPAAFNNGNGNPNNNNTSNQFNNGTNGSNLNSTSFLNDSIPVTTNPLQKFASCSGSQDNNNLQPQIANHLSGSQNSNNLQDYTIA